MLGVHVEGGTGAGSKRPKKDPPKPWECYCTYNFVRHGWEKRCDRCRAPRPSREQQERAVPDCPDCGAKMNDVFGDGETISCPECGHGNRTLRR